MTRKLKFELASEYCVFFLQRRNRLNSFATKFKSLETFSTSFYACVSLPLSLALPSFLFRSQRPSFSALCWREFAFARNQRNPVSFRRSTARLVSQKRRAEKENGRSSLANSKNISRRMRAAQKKEQGNQGTQGTPGTLRNLRNVSQETKEPKPGT